MVGNGNVRFTAIDHMVAVGVDSIVRTFSEHVVDSCGQRSHVKGAATAEGRGGEERKGTGKVNVY